MPQRTPPMARHTMPVRARLPVTGAALVLESTPPPATHPGVALGAGENVDGHDAAVGATGGGGGDSLVFGGEEVVTVTG